MTDSAIPTSVHMRVVFVVVYVFQTQTVFLVLYSISAFYVQSSMYNCEYVQYQPIDPNTVWYTVV